jgi:TIR domain
LVPQEGGIFVRRPRIFLNYRREDTRGYAGRLYDRLSNRFGEDQIFRDIDAIPPGVDFLEHIDGVVNECDLMLVLIGESWISVKDARGRRRLDDPHDFVGVEIAAALERDIPVIPVLIQGATMPTQADLPAHLQGLARRNALEMSDSHWNDDWEQLTRGIDRLLSWPSPRDRPERPNNAADQPAQEASEPPAVPTSADATAERPAARRPMSRPLTVTLVFVPLIVLLAAGYLVARQTGNRSDGDKQPTASATSSTAAAARPTTTSRSVAYPNTSEHQLIKYIPSVMRPSCDRAPKPLAGAVAAVRCVPNNLPPVQYNLFRTKSAMNRLFSSRAKAAGAHTGPCNATRPQHHIDTATHLERKVGRLLCYRTGREARLEWTNELINVYTFSYSKLMARHDMYHKVYVNAGPHPIRHGG